MQFSNGLARDSLHGGHAAHAGRHSAHTAHAAAWGAWRHAHLGCSDDIIDLQQQSGCLGRRLYGLDLHLSRLVDIDAYHIGDLAI